MTRPAPASLVVAAGALVLTLVVTGCGPAGRPASVADTSARTTAPAVRTQAAPCPASRADAPAVAGGLPDLTLACLDPGSGPAKVRLPGLRGRPLVLNIWGSWCVQCRPELPFFAEAAKAGGSRVRFLGVDVEDDRTSAQTFAAAIGLPYNSVVDPDGNTKSTLRWVGPPVTVFYATDGREVGRHVGPVRDRAELDALVRRYLGVDLG
jgi:cytochrome c biogenesis protein CcmG, thiol:disulfide interchange protein DsbE